MIDVIPVPRIRKRAGKINVDSIIPNSIQANEAKSRQILNDFVTVHSPNTYHPNLRRDNNKITIGQSCLLIPAIFLVWWYWTKRTARRVVHGVITFTRGSSSLSVDRTTTTICSGAENDDTDPYFNGCTAQPSSPTSSPIDQSSHYQSWNDNFTEGSSTDSSAPFGFMHWMKRAKVFRTRHKVRATTLHNLHHKNESNNVTEQSSTRLVDTAVASTTGSIDVYHDMDTAKFVTHVQESNSPHDTDVEMFVIEYPQLPLSHPSNTQSIL